MLKDYIPLTVKQVEEKINSLSPIEFENLEDGMYGYYESYSGTKYPRFFFEEYLNDELIIKVYEFDRLGDLNIRYANKDIHRFKHEYKILGKLDLAPVEETNGE